MSSQTTAVEGEGVDDVAQAVEAAVAWLDPSSLVDFRFMGSRHAEVGDDVVLSSA